MYLVFRQAHEWTLPCPSWQRCSCSSYLTLPFVSPGSDFCQLCSTTMTRSSFALVLLASSTVSAHVYPRQIVYSNTTTVDVQTEQPVRPPGSKPLPEKSATSLDALTWSSYSEETTISLEFSTVTYGRDTATVAGTQGTTPVETTQTSFDRPTVPTAGNFTTQLTAHTEKSQTTLERPGTISWVTWDTSTQITLPVPHTESRGTTLNVPKSTQSTASKVVTLQPGSTLDVPGGPPATANQPGTAVGVEKPGQNTGSPRPDENDGKPDNGNEQSSPGGNQGQLGSGRPEGDQGPAATQIQNTARATASGLGGLISVIQAVATKQAGEGQYAQNGQKDKSNSPAGVISTAAPGSKSLVTGFAIGSQTASPGGAAFTRGGSTFSALPSGSGLQVVADGQTRTIANTVSPEVTGAHGSDSDDSYVVGDDTLTAGGAAITNGGSVYSALPNGLGVQVFANGNTVTVPSVPSTSSSGVQAGEIDGEYVFEGHTLTVGGQTLTSGGATFSALPSGGGILIVSKGHINTLIVSGSTSPTSVQAGNSDEEYVLDGKTLTAGGDALITAGTTYSALPSGSGIAIAADGTSSTASVGDTVDTVTAGSDLGIPTPVLLPAGPEQVITIGDKTYKAHITDGSLLVLGSQTIRPDVTTVINGETLILNGTDLVLATGMSTSTRGLGESIMSGIDGESGSEKGSDATETSESPASTAEPASGARQRSLSDMRVLLGCLMSLMFALVLL